MYDPVKHADRPSAPPHTGSSFTNGNGSSQNLHDAAYPNGNTPDAAPMYASTPKMASTAPPPQVNTPSRSAMSISALLSGPSETIATVSTPASELNGNQFAPPRHAESQQHSSQAPEEEPPAVEPPVATSTSRLRKKARRRSISSLGDVPTPAKRSRPSRAAAVKYEDDADTVVSDATPSIAPSTALRSGDLLEDLSSEEDDDHAHDAYGSSTYSVPKAMWDLRWAKRARLAHELDGKLENRRRMEQSIRLVQMLEKRARLGKKAFENAARYEAHHRATLDVGNIREYRAQQLEARQKRWQEEHAAAAAAYAAAQRVAMAPPKVSPEVPAVEEPPSRSRNRSKKKREEAVTAESVAAASAAAAAAAIAASAADDSLLETASVMTVETQAQEVPQPEPIDAVEELQSAIWLHICRREIPRVHKYVTQIQSTRLSNQKKTVQMCATQARRWQMRTNKSLKDVQMRAKRAMREVLVFWKRNERGEKLDRQKAERELLDKAKKEEEEREARRQSRKLNFLISQTEIYSHFIGKKIKTDEAEAGEGDGPAIIPVRRGNELPDVAEPLKPGEIDAPLDFDADDDEALRRAAARNAQAAVDSAREKAQGFDDEAGGRDPQQSDPDAMDLDFQNPTTLGAADIKQPGLLSCTLKEYQLKGLNWLVNLYEQGINGILADEMGLGKTVQSISVMAHLAETYGIWGPFLVIAPASTLHNWQQEIVKFVPRLKPLPYWGSQKDRKVLRKFWDRKRLKYTEDAPFHVVVTSYQLVVQDAQYFKGVKWQYMILDEAQAIKSSSSSRWKALLAFKCRNRLLLTGTPIQNTMQELWALLHFIMPTLFDSHDEFSEWFSKDIENHAQKNSELNEQQLRRLHMILKPFMLRRVKKNVQKELGDKIELDVFCDLNMRQRELYAAVRRQISMKDIIERAASGGDGDLSSLMNLVMQLRKVCNHPDLFERADVRSPLNFGIYPAGPSIAKVQARPQLDIAYATRAAVKLNVPRLVFEMSRPAETSDLGMRRKLASMLDIYRPDNAMGSTAFASARLAGLSAAEVLRARQDPVAGWQQAARRCGISKHPLQISILPKNVTPLGPLAHLMNIRRDYCRAQLLHYINPMYDAKASAPVVDVSCPDSTFTRQHEERLFSPSIRRMLYGPSLPEESEIVTRNLAVDNMPPLLPHLDQERRGFNSIRVPSMDSFIANSGKLAKLDALLAELKRNDHRVLLYFQMTRMIDLMEEYLIYRQYKYLRLDGSSKISDRRDMVSDWQTRPELFVFLLSTRAGGLGINLTAADTVIFYDSDWNPTIDSQAMDRAHRLGQTKQVTVYRLITRNTIEERILHRAKQKEEVQKVVISGGDYRQGGGGVDFQQQKTASRDVVSWLLTDEDAEKADRLAAAQQAAAAAAAASGKGSGNKFGSRRATSKLATAKPLNMDELYHEGEGHMTPDDGGSSSYPSVPGSPKLSKSSIPTVAPGSSKKKSSKKLHLQH
ncbi:Putative DNA helicase ino80 [Savitreella phatthalungensis]